jgi:iron complex transport system ATP-binding protein
LALDRPFLVIEDLRFSYGNREVIRGLSLRLEQGGFLGIVGPNGSGKTTLLKLLAGIFSPSSGKIHVEGQDVLRLRGWERARRIALVPQESTVFFPFSVLEVVLMGRSPYLGMHLFETGEDLGKAREAMEMTDIWFLRDRCFYELSGGEKQRVIIARAITQEPRLLLLDEPTSFLDIGHQVKIYDLIRDLNRSRKLTVVTVLHDLNLACQYCQETILLHEGGIHAMGAPEAVMTYRNIRKLYNTDVYIDINPLTGKLIILPLSLTL